MRWWIRQRRRHRAAIVGRLSLGTPFGDEAISFRRRASSAASANSQSRHAFIFGSVDVACGQTIQ